MSAYLSRPVFICLCLSAVASIIVQLIPEYDLDHDGDLLAVPKGLHEVRESIPAEIKKPTLSADTARDLSQGFVPYQPPPPRIEPVMIVVQKPVAPNPHFTYMGKMNEGEKTIAFIGTGDNVETIPIGEQIDYNWRLDEVEDGGVVLTYLPFNEQRRLFAKER